MSPWRCISRPTEHPGSALELTRCWEWTPPHPRVTAPCHQGWGTSGDRGIRGPVSGGDEDLMGSLGEAKPKLQRDRNCTRPPVARGPEHRLPSTEDPGVLPPASGANPLSSSHPQIGPNGCVCGDRSGREAAVQARTSPPSWLRPGSTHTASRVRPGQIPQWSTRVIRETGHSSEPPPFTPSESPRAAPL